MDNYIGRLLDNRYEILENIGTGGMAVVYKALDHRLNRPVAIKILKEELSENEEFRLRFQAESKAIAMLSHPNIVNVYDVSHSGDIDYIVMELIEGITLKQYMEQKGQLNWREALHFATQITKALEHAHSRDIIHRDIKPHNIMVLKDGSVKVADFGIALVSSAQHTLTREALGSVHYISPEQAKGAYMDFRSDLYSLGVVMYEMLVGRPPYDGDTPVSVAIQHISATPTPPRTLNSAIPEGLEQITMHAMSANLNTRYPSATRMLHDLEEFRKDPGIVFDFSGTAEDSDVTKHTSTTHHLPGEPVVDASQPARTEKPRKTEPAKSSDNRRGSRIALVAGIVCIALAIGGILYFLYHFFISDLFRKTQEDIVPTLAGSSIDSFRESDYPNFTFETEWKPSDHDYGYIIEQSPSGGRTAKVGSTVQLTVSAGPEVNSMPPLVNLSLQNANAALDALPIDVSVDVEYQTSDVFTDGYVISTVPAAGEPLRAGQAVRLIVSQGVEIVLVEVPPLVGEDQDTALATIDAAGLGRGSIRYDDSDLPAGTVIFQSIDPGQQVKAETVINLRVSKGPVEAEEPIILSLSEDAQVTVGDEVLLTIEAQAPDEGTLRYAWYVSDNGSQADAIVVSRSAEDNTTCVADTSQPGVLYYYCKVVNMLGDSKASVDSDMIEVRVEEPIEYHEKTLTLTLPTASKVYTVVVYIDDVPQMEPYEIDPRGLGKRDFQIPVKGAGVQKVEIFLDGILYDTQMIDFDQEGEHGR